MEIALSMADRNVAIRAFLFESIEGTGVGQEVIFVALLGLALGVGKVLDRLKSKDLIWILAPLAAALPPLIILYSWSYGFPVELMLGWLSVCTLLGLFSSRVTHA